MSGEGGSSAGKWGSVTSEDQHGPTPGKRHRRCRFRRVQEELGHGPGGEGEEKRRLGGGYRVELEVRVDRHSLRTDGQHVWLAVDLIGFRAVVMVAVTTVAVPPRGLEVGLRMAMRQTVPDLRQENTEAENQQEYRAGEAGPAEAMHGRQGNTGLDRMSTRTPRGAGGGAGGEGPYEPMYEGIRREPKGMQWAMRGSNPRPRACEARALTS